MDKRKYEVTLVVEVDAFDEDDAWDALQDAFGVGGNSPGIEVLECEWEFKK
jgi:hypothetical protein